MEYGTDSKLMWLDILRLANSQCNDYEFCCIGSRLWHLKRAAGELWLMLENGPPEGLVDLPYLAHSDFCRVVEDVDGEFDKEDCGCPPE